MQNKIKLYDIVESTLNNSNKPVIMCHHNRGFINECLQTLSEKNINRFHQGLPVDSIIIPISMKDRNAEKIEQLDLEETVIGLILENYALSKMVIRTFQAAGDYEEKDKGKEAADKELLKEATEFQQTLKSFLKGSKKRSVGELQDYFIVSNSFAHFCERAFNKTKVHMLFTDIQHLSIIIQKRLDALVEQKFPYLKIGFAVETDDLRTRHISEVSHLLESNKNVNCLDLDMKYWRENVYNKKYELSHALKGREKYIRDLREAKKQYTLPLPCEK